MLLLRVDVGIHFELGAVGCVVVILADEGYEVAGEFSRLLGGVGVPVLGVVRTRRLDVHLLYCRKWH